MLTKILSGANLGIEAIPVTVEVDVASFGLPGFSIVGLADRAIEESKERVRTAIRNSGAEFPPRRLTVNLAPAEVPKEGAIFDLAIAVGLLISSGQIESKVSDALIAGELSLDGSLRYTQGILSLVLLAKKMGISRMIIPKDNGSEASIINGVEIYTFESLVEVVQYLTGSLKVEPLPPLDLNLDEPLFNEYDFAQIKGQEQAKRALEIAAAGAHNVLLKGPPGSGKTLLARSFPSILPQLDLEEALEITQIYSVSGQLSKEQPLIKVRPFRSPHHTASYVGIIGGGNSIKPGEVSLAHRGVLFMDELPEFTRQVLESLRQPIEDKRAVISRATGSLTFPAQFILLAAMNPCPCGFLFSTNKSCSCMPGQVSRYQKKLSGPLLDRIDIHLDVPAVDVDKLTVVHESESSAVVRERVKRARDIQKIRFQELGIITNSEMGSALVRKFCDPDSESITLLKEAIIKMNLSARSYYRILKLSRTIADLEGSENIKLEHIMESLQYRAKQE